MAEKTPLPLDCSSASGAGAATVVEMEILTAVEVRDGPAPDESEDVVTDVEVVALNEQAALMAPPEELPVAAAPPAPPPMVAEEALRQAEAEGLTLLKSESSNTGYKGVTFMSSRSRPYQAQVRHGGEKVTLGSFATAEEAALAYARSPEAQAAAAAPRAPPPMTAEEALRQAEAEGLTLLKSEGSNTGYKGVRFVSGRRKPYQAEVRRGGNSVNLGTFATAEEAALAYARLPEAQAAVAAAAATPAPPPMTAEEALRQAEAEGLTLVRSESSNTGYKGVIFYHAGSHGRKTNGFLAQVWRGGKQVTLGTFATAEEAALAYACTPEAQAAVAAAAAAPPKPPPMTAEEALRQAEAEGLPLLRSTDGGNTGYKGVSFKSGGRSKPYQAHVRRGGEAATLGSFATAEEAALVVARTPEGRAAAATAAEEPPAPPPMTAEEALRQAETEGLTMVLSESSATGYKGVSFNNNTKTKTYTAKVQRDGKHATLGSFATAEEAALVVARTPEAQAAVAAAAEAPPAPPPMTAEEALRQAEAEGLTLLRATGASGYWGVGFNSRRNVTRPYQAQVRRGGKYVSLRTFATAEEAALVVARTPEGRAAVAAAAAAQSAPPPLTAEEAVAQAEAEGLTLLRSESSSTGYKNVSFDRNMKTRCYKACAHRGGEKMSLGHFATAEEAALVLARTPERRAAAAATAAPPAPPPLMAEEAAHAAAPHPPGEAGEELEVVQVDCVVDCDVDGDVDECEGVVHATEVMEGPAVDGADAGGGGGGGGGGRGGRGGVSSSSRKRKATSEAMSEEAQGHVRGHVRGSARPRPASITRQRM